MNIIAVMLGNKQQAAHPLGALKGSLAGGDRQQKRTRARGKRLRTMIIAVLFMLIETSIAGGRERVGRRNAAWPVRRHRCFLQSCIPLARWPPSRLQALARSPSNQQGSRRLDALSGPFQSIVQEALSGTVLCGLKAEFNISES
jgi:hypothetical protein